MSNRIAFDTSLEVYNDLLMLCEDTDLTPSMLVKETLYQLLERELEPDAYTRKRLEKIAARKQALLDEETELKARTGLPTSPIMSLRNTKVLNDDEPIVY